ncbi:MAG TPA: bacteriohopanetetrol glucosamine biosynthesis glycosyltransferase HpnI [Terriglobales bacterium]|nr:bacteriohopanetetrol glucosamine biosynthesis glycosyltransferase HpnI [Terriglobales bacterium]
MIFLRIIEFVAVTAATASIAYYALCLWSAVRFQRDSASAGKSACSTQNQPAVSILKPLKGTDPEMYECFRSHCLQQYPAYELIFGVSDVDDPAIDLVERLKAEFPQNEICLVHCSQNLGSNTKVSNLAQMLPHARYEHIIVADSDIRVPPDYLPRVLAPLADPAIGLVTCPYRGVPNDTPASRLESLGISTDFFPGVLVARNIEGIKFGLGSTLAFRRRDLVAIGGFEALLDYLADDYEIGRRITAMGMHVELSDVIVDSILPRYTMKGFLDHQLRWARTVKNARPGGYIGLVITFGLPWVLLALILAGGAIWAWLLLAITLIARFGVAAYIQKKVLREPQTGVLWWLPLRDILALGVWAISFTGDTVTWRGASYTLKNGKLARTAP